MDDNAALVVIFEIRDFAKAQAQIKAIADQIKGMQSPMGRANRDVQGHVKVVQMANGAWKGLAQAVAAYDAKVKSAMAKKALTDFNAFAKAEGKSQASSSSGSGDFGRAFRNWIYTMRFSSGPHGMTVSPLIGRTIQMFAALPGPLKLFAAALAVAVPVVENFAKTMNQFRQTQILGGASAKEVFQAQQIGQVFGVEPHDIQSIAAQFAQTLGSGGYGTGFFAGKGIMDPLGGTPFGNKDQIKQLLKAINALASATDEERVRLLRAAPELGPFARAGDMTPGQMRQMQGLAGAADKLLPKDFAATLQEFNFKTAMASQALGMFVRTVGYWLMKAVNWFLGWMGVPSGNEKKARDAADRARKATDENTDATDRLNTTMKGIFGGGERARGAMPPALRGPALSQGLRDHAIRLGAFAL